MKGTPSFRRIFYFGDLLGFNIFLRWANEIGSLPKTKKKNGLVKHPQLINMKQKNKYPQIYNGGVNPLMSHSLCPFAISPGQNWWQTTLEIKVSCNQWKGSTCTLQGSSFFLFGGGGLERYFFVFFHVPNVFPMCSHHVPQVPKLFPKTFPIAHQFYPIWFAQSSTLMYVNWKGGL